MSKWHILKHAQFALDTLQGANVMASSWGRVTLFVRVHRVRCVITVKSYSQLEHISKLQFLIYLVMTNSSSQHFFIVFCLCATDNASPR